MSGNRREAGLAAGSPVPLASWVVIMLATVNLQKKIAFEKYYNQYYQVVYGHFMKKIQNPAEAEDLTMEIFLKCWEKFDTFDPEKASFGTWLFVIVNNRLKNYYRDKKDFDPIDDLEQRVSPQDSFEDGLLEVDYFISMRKYLAEALELLPEVQRTIVIARYYREKSANEIALETGLTAVNVRVHLSRAIAKIKKYFDENGIEWEK